MKLTEQERQDIYLAHYPTVQEIEAYLDYCEYEPTVKVIKLKLAATKTSHPSLTGLLMRHPILSWGPSVS